MSDDRIALLAALVQRKWSMIHEQGRELDLVLVQEWAAASLLLELAQDHAIRVDQSYFVATRVANELFVFVRDKAQNINQVRDGLIELCLPTEKE